MDRQRIGLWGTVIFAGAAVVGMIVQLYLIGGFIFGETGWLDAHKDFGKAVHLAYILTFISALVAAWPNWRATLWPFVLAVLGSIQAFLAGGGTSPTAVTRASTRSTRPSCRSSRARALDRLARLEYDPGVVHRHDSGDLAPAAVST